MKPPSTTPAPMTEPVIHRARVPVDGIQSCEVCGDILVDLSGAVAMNPNGGRFWPARALVDADSGLVEVGAPTCTPQEQDPAILRRLLARANATITDQRRTITDLARQGAEVRAVLDETRGQLAAAENSALHRLVAPVAGIEAVRVEGVVEAVRWNGDLAIHVDGKHAITARTRVAVVALPATGTKEGK